MRLNILLVGSALLLGACGKDAVTVPEDAVYLEPTSPENVIENLMTAYLERDIEEYSSLLAPEFIFKVQPADVIDFGDSFSRDRDVAGTAGLFNTPLVSDIRIDLTYDPAAAPTEMEFAPGTMKIRVTHTFLEVDETTGITWQIDGDIQDIFFRQGFSAEGENPDHWLIIEWRDILENAFSETGKLAAVPHLTWGRLRRKYESPPSLDTRRTPS